MKSSRNVPVRTVLPRRRLQIPQGCQMPKTLQYAMQYSLSEEIVGELEAELADLTGMESCHVLDTPAKTNGCKSTSGSSTSTESATQTEPTTSSNSSTTTTATNNELRIIIIDENWSQYCYRIKINTPFGKLINRFCQQVRKADNKQVLFWYHGRLVEDEDTPRTLNIKDGEVILAHYIK